jgi:hypothetical protein
LQSITIFGYDPKAWNNGWLNSASGHRKNPIATSGDSTGAGRCTSLMIGPFIRSVEAESPARATPSAMQASSLSIPFQN